jgi:hypothetical protein
VSMWSAHSEARTNDIDTGVAAATPWARAGQVGAGGELDHTPGHCWWADRQTDVRGLGPQFGYSQKGCPGLNTPVVLGMA